MAHPQSLSPEAPGPAAPAETAADVVIGVPAADNAATIEAVLRAARDGAARVAGARAVLAFADGGSTDATPARAAEACRDAGSAVPVVDLAAPAAGRGNRPAGKAGALREILAHAQRVGAKACVVLDPDLLGATPSWVGRLLAPVLQEEADFAAPMYVQPRFAGAVTSGIVYPVTRALYGRRLRFPLGGDFACSPRLVQHWLARGGTWDRELGRSGPELWLSTQAIIGGFRLRQVVLGPKWPAAGAAAEDLPQALARVLGALFAEADRNAALWQRVRGSEPVEVRGVPAAEEPEPGTADIGRAIEAFRLGQRNLADLWALVLPPLTLLELKRLARLPDAEFRFPDALLARIVYDFALAYRMRTINRDHLLSAFTPLYLGCFASLAAELRDADQAAAEARVERLCRQYEVEKPYLISRWRWPDRFSP